MGKARLSPVKKTTISRLELTEATIAVKIGRTMNAELEVKPESIIYHTDSTTVLHYIHSEKKRFPVFVANRVQVIQDYSETCQWRYVDSKSNPADIASRGLTSPDLIQQTCWIDGPSFLKNQKEIWPVQPVDFQHSNQEPPDYAQETDCNALNIEQSITTVYTLINHYSDWYKLKKAVAIFMKLRKTPLNRKTQKTVSNAPLTTADLEKAEEAIVKFIQAQHFDEEIRTLQKLDSNETERSQRGREKYRVVSKSSLIYRLDPFLDNKGLLRVGGRLCRAEDMKYEMKHPLLLPPKGHVSMLIARDSFINALRRFIARRGAVQRIRCDNGTNFVGSRRELWNALSEMDHSSIREQLLKHDIDWIFNPPAASPMGVWERQIGTVRKILSPMLKEFGECLDEESFRT